MKINLKKVFRVFTITAIVCACFAACENPIMGEWWRDSQQPEVEYVALLKKVPQITYERIIEEKYITIIEQLPPEVITEYIFETLPPEVIFEIVEVEVIHEQIVEVEVIREVIREIVIKETEYLDPTPEQIIEYIKQNPDVIIEVIRENEVIREEIITVIREYLTDEQIKEIIKELPPELIMEYLTDVQIKYIIQNMPPEQIIQYLDRDQIIYIINQQPPQVILQNIKIITIEYIIFSGDSIVYNGPPGPGATTDLSSQERITNDRIVDSMARILAENPNYMIILHGHANPVNFTPEELEELDIMSRERAVSVQGELERKFLGFSGGVPIDSERRVSAIGYGGGKNISLPAGSYAQLNRRVEVILFEITSMTL